MQAGSQTLLKLNNQRAIIDCILANGPISRADLSKHLCVSKPTISANVINLMEKDLLIELGYTETDIGKRPLLFDFNKNFRYILALDFISYITNNIVSVSVCNLSCEPLFIDSIDLGENFSARSMGENFPKDLFALFEKNNVQLDKIEVVVLTAASVFYDSEHVRLECRNGDTVNLAAIIRPVINKEIIVQNDINMAALGEKHFGIGKNVNNLLFVWAGLAVGGGLIINGELYQGINNGGGELAYATVYSDVLGEYLFLKDVLSLRGVRHYIEQKREDAQQSEISERLFSRKLTLSDIVKAAKAGDEFCLEFAKYVARILTAVICNLSETLDLEMAIIGGEYSHFGDLLTDEIKKRIALMPITDTIIATPLHSNSAMYGAFKMGCEYIMERII